MNEDINTTRLAFTDSSAGLTPLVGAKPDDCRKYWRLIELEDSRIRIARIACRILLVDQVVFMGR